MYLIYLPYAVSLPLLYLAVIIIIIGKVVAIVFVNFKLLMLTRIFLAK
jgi:hypothetical protein